MINTIAIMNEYIAMRNGNSESAIADDGLIGKAFECAIRSYMANRRILTVKSQGKVDIRSRAFDGTPSDTEIKTACGELDDTFRKSCKWIIYCPDVDLELEAEYQAYVFSRDEWIDFLNGYTGRGQMLRKTTNGKTHIQSFYVSTDKRPKASKALADYIWDTCLEHESLANYYTHRQ